MTTLKTTPSQIVDLHGDLVDRLRGGVGSAMRNIIASQLDASARKHTLYGAERDIDQREWASADAVVNSAQVSSRIAGLYTVTPDMATLLLHAAAGLDGTDRFDVQSAPTEAGLVRFDRPLEFKEVRGRNQKIHWIMWHRGRIQNGPGATPRTGMLIHMLNDLDDPDEVTIELVGEGHLPEMAEIRRQVGRWSYIALDFANQDQRIGELERPVSDEQRAQVLAEEPGIEVPDSQINIVRIVHALFLMLNQTVVSTREETADRLSAKRARRMNLPQRVTVIDLRRVEYPVRSEGETLVEWQHRWLVRGYWRWQWYGSGPDRHQERIWVAGHVKGPADKPLVVTQKVHALRR